MNSRDEVLYVDASVLQGVKERENGRVYLRGIYPLPLHEGGLKLFL